MNTRIAQKAISFIEEQAADRMTRRQTVRMLGAFGITAVALPTLARGVSAHQGDHATPAAALIPGPREDGTNLWKVRVGGMDMENEIDIQAFLPGEITINAGDAIWFEFNMMPGFHSVTFTSGAEPPALVIQDPNPDAGTPVTVPPTMLINPEFLFPAGGDTYDGTGYLNSGADIFRDETTPPFVITFTTPGTFSYQCVPHGLVMQGTIVVQASGSALPYDQAAYDRMGDEQYAALVDVGLAAIEEHSEAIATTRADGTTLWELSDGAGGQTGARVMRILPESIEIETGDTIRWVNRSPGEAHTVTFLSGEAPPEDSIVVPQQAGPPKLFQSNATFLPAGGPVYNGTGYVNSGFLSPVFPAGDTFELTFDTPGVFPYYCILHGDTDGSGMSASVTVKNRT